MILIGISGACGAICRYFIATWFVKKAQNFPYATLLVNCSGTLLLGIFYRLYSYDVLSEIWWYNLGIAFLGSFTTVSTFGYEVVTMVYQRKLGRALIYIVMSLLLGLGFAMLGWTISSYFIN